MSTMVLIRGLPGSGKSSLAYEIANYEYGCDYFEADMFFEDNGEYRFDASKLREAHQWCLNRTGDALFAGKSVVVSNTFTTFEEMRQYFHLANDFGCKLVVIECTGNFGTIHGVPEATIERMRDRWLPTEKLWEIGEGFQNLKTMNIGVHDGIRTQWDMNLSLT